MGWLDDLKKGFASGHASGTERASRTTERLYTSREREIEQSRALEELNYESDSVLFSKLKSIFTSDAEKTYIEGILLSRGYQKTDTGSFDKF